MLVASSRIVVVDVTSVCTTFPPRITVTRSLIAMTSSSL